MATPKSHPPPARPTVPFDRVGDDPHRQTTANRLLAAFPREDFAWLVPHLERVTLGIGQVLAEPGEPFAHVYFPETAIASVGAARARHQMLHCVRFRT